MKKILYFLLVLPLVVSAQDQDKNYIKNTSYKIPTTVSIPNPAPTQANVNVAYFDGLGRPIQQIARGQSGTGKDLVTPITYDGFGRQAKDYLPYPLQNSGMAYDAAYATNQQGYYTTTYGASQTNAYSEKILENSPLGRPLERGAPGIDWKANPASDTDHTIKYEYLSNTASPATEKVRLFTATATWNSTLELFVPSLNNADGTVFYAADRLYKAVVKDENWTTGKDNTVEEYKNLQGQVVLKRTFESGSAHDTYYVYDKYGNLTYVVPPLASGSLTQAELDGLCYQYRYDSRNRLVEKKLPGKQWEYIVYDKLDRVVMTGPANSPFGLGTVGWLFTKYDAYSRPAYTGWYNGQPGTQAGRVALQQAQNGYTAFNEGRVASNTVGGVAVGYSNTVFPTASFSLLTVSYYDDYNFPNAPAVPTTVLSDGSQAVYYNNTLQPKGMPTGSWIRVLESETAFRGQASYILYDSKGRAVRNHTSNYLGGYTRVDRRIDFAGKTLYTETTHKRLASDTELYVKDSFTYTDQDRPLAHLHQIGTTGIPQLLSMNAYDELGQLKNKRVGGTDTTAATYFQKADYSYTIRGWLKGINNINDLADGATADLFAFGINYAENSATASAGELSVPKLYNGNISETFWRTSSDNIKRKYGYRYDALNRLLSAAYQRPGTTTVANSYNEAMDYDRNGNILHLSRTGEYDDQSYALVTDELDYSYAANSNTLAAVSDRQANPNGFMDGTNTGNDYTYDADGNLLSDQNKGIWEISYNHLNLPVKITFAERKNIGYLYDATGVKVRKSAPGYNDSLAAVTYTTDYLEGFQYLDGLLNFFPTAEGYVRATTVGTARTYNYVFNYTDHLGNNRLSYGLDAATGTVRIIEENNYYPFGLRHRNYNMLKLDYDQNGGLHEFNLNSAAAKAFKYKYNGKEWQDEMGVNWYDYGARNYDAAIGRWMNIDPLAEKMRRYSPYTYALDSPVFFIDPDGMQATYNWAEHEKGNTGVYTDGDKNVSFEEALSQATGENSSNIGGDPPGKNNNFLSRLRDKTKKWANENIREPIKNALKPFREGVAMAREVNHEIISGELSPLFELQSKVGGGTASGLIASRGSIAKVGEIITEEAPLLLNQFNSVESFIAGAGRLTRVKAGLQGFVEGNGASIFKAISNGGTVQPNGTVIMEDGTTLFNHYSTKTGAYTIDINKAGQVYKIRVKE